MRKNTLTPSNSTLTPFPDQDGQLTVNELTALFAELNVKCTKDEVVKLVEALDKGAIFSASFLLLFVRLNSHFHCLSPYFIQMVTRKFHSRNFWKACDGLRSHQL
jgi:hypothetical protein